MDLDTLTPLLVDELATGHHCHTVILYGSWARGEATPASDIDVLGVRADGESYCIARPLCGLLLDAWIYSEATLPGAEKLLQLEDGIVLVEADGWGTRLLDKVHDHIATPAPSLAAWQREQRITWIAKMVERARAGDVIGNYRRHWLLFELLETWFAFTEQRYLGPRRALQHLEAREPAIFQLFEEALVPGASLDAIERLCQAVISADAAPRRGQG